MGFGLFAGVELLTYALYSGAHIRGEATNLANMTTYNLSILVWMYYTFRNRQDFRVPVLIPQRWDDALTDIQTEPEPESLIPMFEHMVDRAFSKANDNRP